MELAETKRRLAAILAADVAGYSRLMGDDEAMTVATLTAYRTVFRDRAGATNGRIVDTAGDSVLAVFDSVVDAVLCAMAVQKELAGRNADLLEPRRMHFRIGVNLGDILEHEDGTVYGDGVNVAARLESLAMPGGLMISETAQMQLDRKLTEKFTDAGTQQVKNITRPIKTFAWDDGITPTRTFANDGRKPRLVLGEFVARADDQDTQMLAEGAGDAVARAFSDQTGIELTTDETRADYMASVRIQSRGGRYRASLHMLDRAVDRQFASEQFDGDLTDLFEAEDDLSYRLYSTMRFEIHVRQAAKVADRPDTELSTQDLLAKAGVHLFSADPHLYADAVRITTLILEREPDNFMALAMQARARLGAYIGDYRSILPDDRTAALDAARRAVRLNPQSEVTHVVLAAVLTFCDIDLDEAIAAARRSLEIKPTYMIAEWQLGTTLIYADAAEEGLPLCLKANSADPQGPLNHRFMWHIALGHFALEDFASAADWAQRSDQHMPDVAPTLLILTTASVLANQSDLAGRTVDRLRTIYPDFALNKLRRWPFREAAVWSRFVDGLRRAGLE